MSAAPRPTVRAAMVLMAQAGIAADALERVEKALDSGFLPPACAAPITGDDLPALVRRLQKAVDACLTYLGAVDEAVPD
jgi:hypothetical protein